jgi:hypothetical protein
MSQEVQHYLCVSVDVFYLSDSISAMQTMRPLCKRWPAQTPEVLKSRVSILDTHQTTMPTQDAPLLIMHGCQ